MKHGVRNYIRGLLVEIQVWKREKTEMEVEMNWVWRRDGSAIPAHRWKR